MFFAASGSINVFLWVVTGRRFGFQSHNSTERRIDASRVEGVDMDVYGGEDSPRQMYDQEVDIYSVGANGNGHGAAGQYEWSASGVDARR